MELLKIVNNSYLHYGSLQFPSDLGLILGSELIEAAKSNPGIFDRTFSDLHEESPDTRVNSVFGVNMWGAIKKLPWTIGLLSDDLTVDLEEVYSILDLAGIIPKYIRFDNTYSGSEGNYHKADSYVNASAVEYNITTYTGAGRTGGIRYQSGTPLPKSFGVTDTLYAEGLSSSLKNLRISVHVYPNDLFVNGQINEAYAQGEGTQLTVNITLTFNNELTEINTISTGVQVVNAINDIVSFFGDIDIPETAQKTDDMDNPYGEPGTSGPGGGDGSYGNPDEVDPTAVPDLPTISASSTGFITIYNPTSANLSSLGGFLWSNLFDIDTFKKLYTDPMDCIISLGIVPCVPNSAGTQNIKFGNVDTGINCSYLATQYVKVDCGSVDITKYVGSFMDYSPYVKISLFLPYIGFINLGTDDIMGGSINVTYHVDILSGDCIAFITHSSKGVLYSYTGNCLTNVPVTAANYANSLRNYYEAVSGIIPSTCNGAASGGAAGAASGAINGALSAASNIILNTKPDYQRSGSLGGSSGIMGVQKPFIVIERPNISVPNKVQHYMGQMSNITANLGGLSGMTIVEAVHLEGVPATTEEIAEIESMLKAGVIL